MNLKGYAKYAVIGLRAAIEEHERELVSLKEKYNRLLHAQDTAETSLKKAWAKRGVSKKRKFPKLTPKQLKAMRKNAALARKAALEKHKVKGVA